MRGGENEEGDEKRGGEVEEEGRREREGEAVEGDVKMNRIRYCHSLSIFPMMHISLDCWLIDCINECNVVGESHIRGDASSKCNGKLQSVHCHCGTTLRF